MKGFDSFSRVGRADGIRDKNVVRRSCFDSEYRKGTHGSLSARYYSRGIFMNRRKRI